MAASYPNSVKTFTTKSDGAGNTIQAEHVNSLQDEVNAIEAGLLNGTAPLTASNASLVNLTVSGGSTFASFSIGNSTLGNLNVSSGSTLARLNVTGGSTLASLVVAGGSTLATLEVSGGSTLASLGVTGGSTLGSLVLSSAAPTPAVANTLYKDLLPKAWARVTSSGEILGSVNISSVTLSGASLMSFAFAAAMASSNYAVLATIANFNSTTQSTVVGGARNQASTGFAVQGSTFLAMSVLVFGAQ